MPMTMTEKILAEHAGLAEVKPGQLINARLDAMLANDITGPLAIQEFNKLGLSKLPYPEKVILVPDHFVPNKDIKSAEQAKILRDFAGKHQLPNYFEVGRMGIEHCLLPEQGLVAAGEVIIGADSHTCTYGALGAFATGVGSTDLAAAMATGEAWFKVPETIKVNLNGKLNPWVSGKDLILYLIGILGVDGARYQALEFGGEALKELSMASRFTMANMAIEAGAKNGIFPVDDLTREYMAQRVNRPYKEYQSDADAVYARVIDIDCGGVEPQVACPHLPENTRQASALKGTKIDQVVIGSCTNGRLEDLQVAASILEGKQIHPEIRLIVIPGTQQIYLAALAEGLIKTFVEAGAAVSTPTCGPCLGGYMGILAKGERCLSTTNRNFVGRMGHPESEVYLASPAVAAASALTGRITDPGEVQ